MPNAHSAFRPLPEVEFLGSQRVSLQDVVKKVAAAVKQDNDAGNEMMHTPGTSLISFQQIPRVLKSLQNEWSGVPPVEQPDCFTQVRGRLTMHMHPCFLGQRLMQGMRGAAGLLLMRYRPELKQVPLAFVKLKPAATHAALVGESAYIHFMVEFECIGIRPTQGMNLIGRLARVQTAVGINVTIFDNFNFFVPKMDLPREAWFDGQEGAWMLHDEKLRGRQKSHAFFVKVTRPMDDTYGASNPVNFRGLLADHLPANTNLHHPGFDLGSQVQEPLGDPVKAPAFDWGLPASPLKKPGKKRRGDSAGASTDVPEVAASSAASEPKKRRKVKREDPQ